MATALTDIPGIGPSTAEILQAQGFDSAETLAASTVEKVSEVPGFGTLRATAVIRAANELIGSNAADQSADQPAKKAVKKPSAQKGKKSKKDKSKKDKPNKGKKDKGKTKDKNKKKKDKKKKDKKSKKKK